MDIICIACPHVMLKEEDTRQMIQDLIAGFPRETAFVTETRAIYDIVLSTNKTCSLFSPQKAVFKRMPEAYIDMNIRMLKFVTQLHVYMREGNKNIYYCLMAADYQRIHPGYFMVLNFKTPEGWKEVKLDELKRRERWKF